MYIDVRKLAETKPAFKKLSSFILAIHGKNVKLSSYDKQRENPWSVIAEGYTTPLLCQASLAGMDSQFYPSSKTAMKNMLVKVFLPSIGYTLTGVIETKPQAFWITVKELKEVAFHVFTFRSGGIGVGIASIHGDFGMIEEIRQSAETLIDRTRKAALKKSAASKLTNSERLVLGL